MIESFYYQNQLAILKWASARFCSEGRKHSIVNGQSFRLPIENWKPEWDVSHHFGLFKLSLLRRRLTSEKLLCHNWVSKVPTQSRKSHNTKRHTIWQQKHKNIKKQQCCFSFLPHYPKTLDLRFCYCQQNPHGKLHKQKSFPIPTFTNKKNLLCSAKFLLLRYLAQ